MLLENHPFIAGLIKKLKEPLPGAEAQYEMAHIKREKVDVSSFNVQNYKSSAVLLLLIQRGNDFYIPLTQRHEYNGAHSGQISLPGGKREAEDVDLIQTALRECSEEIGIHSSISILGELTSVYIPVSKFVAQPYIGVFTGENLNYTINANEVKKIIEVNLNDLKNPALIKETQIELAPGIKTKTPYFDVQGHVVWGATAMILNEFKRLL